jgi:hypothetical protein
MKRRFVVGLDSSTKEQNQEFIEFIRGRQLGWWHWISNFWLLTDPGGKLSAIELRLELGKIYPGVHTLVLELSEKDDTWSGFGPKGEDRNMFKWLNDYWKR